MIILAHSSSTWICGYLSCSTIAKVAVWRWFKFIDIKAPAVTHSYLNIPSTAIVTPIKANFSWYYPLLYSGMGITQPTCGICATVTFRYTWCGHTNTSRAFQTVPLNFDALVTCTSAAPEIDVSRCIGNASVRRTLRT